MAYSGVGSKALFPLPGPDCFRKFMQSSVQLNRLLENPSDDDVLDGVGVRVAILEVAKEQAGSLGRFGQGFFHGFNGGSCGAFQHHDFIRTGRGCPIAA